MQSLPADTQRGIGQLVSEHGAGAREHLAYQALGDWSPQEREALRTLAAASPEIRAQALSDTADTGPPRPPRPDRRPGIANDEGEHPQGGAPDPAHSPTRRAPPASSSPVELGPSGPPSAAAGDVPVREPRDHQPDQPAGD